MFINRKTFHIGRKSVYLRLDNNKKNKKMEINKNEDVKTVIIKKNNNKRNKQLEQDNNPEVINNE